MEETSNLRIVYEMVPSHGGTFWLSQRIGSLFYVKREVGGWNGDIVKLPVPLS